MFLYNMNFSYDESCVGSTYCRDSSELCKLAKAVHTAVSNENFFLVGIMAMTKGSTLEDSFEQKNNDSYVRTVGRQVKTSRKKKKNRNLPV